MLSSDFLSRIIDMRKQTVNLFGNTPESVYLQNMLLIMNEMAIELIKNDNDRPRGLALVPQNIEYRSGIIVDFNEAKKRLKEKKDGRSK